MPVNHSLSMTRQKRLLTSMIFREQAEVMHTVLTVSEWLTRKYLTMLPVSQI